MKKVSLLIFALILLLVFVACQPKEQACSHEWTAATCTAAKTCTKCNATEGAAAGHDWAEATCTAPKTCKTCNETEGNPLGHSEVTLEAKAPTCTETGLTAGKKCSRCNTVTQAQETIPATGHDLVQHEAKPATCTEGGWNAYETCNNCDHNTKVEVGAHGHTEVTLEAVDPTCTETGLTAGKKCSVCETVTVEQTVVPATGHDSNVNVPGFAPTCGVAGLTDGKKCSVCGTTTVEQEPIPATGAHIAMGEAEEPDRGQAPTCDEDGYTVFADRCMICDQVITERQEVIPALGHTVPEYTYNNDATCEADGTKTGTCTICQKSVTVTAEGTALGHKMPADAPCGEMWTCENGCGVAQGPREHSMAPATCTDPSTCTNCGHTEGEPAPHTPGEPTRENVVAPGCETPGSYDEVTKCTACDAVISSVPKTIDPTGHNMAPATCDAPSTCENGCGHTEGEKVANHTPVASFDGAALTYTCATCNDTFTTEQVIFYTGADKADLFFTKNGDPSVSIVDGAYSIKAGEQRSQYMIYGPSNDKNHANTMTGWNAQNESFGVFSFRVQPGTITEAMRVIVMSSRNNPNWDANQQTLGTADGWGANSLDILGITPNGDGTFRITGYDVTSNVLATVNGTDWVDVKMFIQINKDGLFTISYYINGAFANTYTYDLLNPEAKKSILNLDINNFYMCGWTAPGTGLLLDDMYFGYQKNCEWLFDEHEHRWADADCENPRHCTACGLVDETAPALGHKEATRDVNVNAPDCVNGGSHDVETYCTVCEKVLNTEHVEDAALGHKPDENNVCTVCGVDLHECNLVADTVVPPTCTEGGYTIYRCDHPGCTKHENRDFTDPAGHTMNAATCTAPATCSVCGHTEGEALGHSYTAPSCAAAETCTVCGATKGQPNANAHKLTSTYVDGKLTYSCERCEYNFVVDTFDYSDGTNYNGMHANASQNNTVYTTNGSNYPVQKDGHLEFIRTDAEAGVQKQAQLWLPTANGGTNKFSGFSSASNSIGYLSFKVNAKTDVNFEFKLVDHRVDTLPDGTGIRWGDQWCINDPVFRVMPVDSNGKVELRGFNSLVIASTTPDENGYTGWYDIAIQLVLDPETDKVIAHYYVNGEYVATSDRPLSTHTNALQAVYINFNSKAAGCGWMLDDLTFGYTAHKHDFDPTFENGVLTYNCACGTNFVASTEVREWNGDGNDSGLQHSANGKWNTVYEDGTFGFMFQPQVDSDWGNYNAPGGQMQPWLPSSNRDANTLSGFSTENNAVGVISFDVKTSMTKVDNAGSTVTVGVGKPRNASDWNDGGSWTDDFFNVLAIMDNGEDYTVKGGVNSGLVLATIPKTDNGWSEWFNVMMVIDLDTDGTMTTYYYINGALIASESRNLGVAAADGRYLNPQKIEAFQISGWTYAAETGMMFDNMYFGYTANGHNTLDGQRHVLTETTCGEKSTCSCGWTGYTVAHTYATDCAALCSVCGAANAHAKAHKNLTPTVVDGKVDYVCSDCHCGYTADTGYVYDGASQIGSWSKNGDMFSVVEDGVNHVYLKDTDGKHVADNGDQYMTWIPSASTPVEFDNFTCANNAVGLAAFKINAFTDSSTGLEFKVNDARGTDAFSWSTTSVGIFRIMPVTSDSQTTVQITGLNGDALTELPLEEGSKWTGWLDVVILIKLFDNNTMSVDYYINGEYIGNISKPMLVSTNKISSFYINGYTKSEDSGYYLDDLYFGYTTNGAKQFEISTKEPFYKEEIAKEDVTNEFLTSIVTNKIKQWDQSSAHNSHEGTPVYVVADKNGEDVQALYFSKTDAWVGDEGEQFSEFRFALDKTKKVVSFSFDYKIDGTVEVNDKYTFWDPYVGQTFQTDAYVQVKTLVAHNPEGATSDDKYPELTGTDLVLDGEWHTMTYTFATPEELENILLNLYHFQGELLIANLEVEYAEENNLYNEDGSLKVEEIGNRNASTDNTSNVTDAALLTIVDGKIKQFDQTNKAAEGDNSYGYFVKEVGTSHYVTLEGKDGNQVEAVYLSRSVDWDTYASVSTQNGFKSEFRFAIDNTKRVTSISFDYILNGTLTPNRSTGNANGQLSIFQIKYTNKADNTFNPNDQYFDVITDRVDGENNFLVTDGEWHTFSYTFENSVQLDNFLIILSEFQGEIVIANLEVTYG